MASYLRQARVFYKDNLAGTLEETVTGGSRFSYQKGWSEDIACCFPVTKTDHDWESGLHPFFQHLTSEGWLREKQALAANIKTENDFGFLLRYGADCIGAVGVRPERESEELPVIAEGTPTPGRTISGVQKKLLVVKDGKGYRPATGSEPASHIAKFNSNSIDTLVRNELRSLTWITALLGQEEVTGFTHGLVENEAALIVTRFDRGPRGEKYRQEDFAQILIKPRGVDYGGKYDSDYETVAELIKKHSSRPVIDLDRFYMRLIAYALIGNCDAHLKNFSLLETPTGFRLSPVYDVVNTVLYPDYDIHFGLGLLGERRPIDQLDGDIFREFGATIGLTKAAIDQTFETLHRRARKAAKTLAPPEAEAPDGFLNRFAEIVRTQCLRILGE